MQLNNYLKSKMHFIGAFSLLFGLASCGSYQYVGQDNDGIYRTTERTVESHEIVEQQEETPAQGSSYYQNYFKEKSQELDNIQEDDLYFTDIDAYEGDYNAENDSITYQGGYTGWGQDNDDVTINIYGGHLYNSIRWNRQFYPSWVWNYGYGYGNVYGYGYGYGYNSYWCPPYYGSIYAGWNSWNYGYPYYNGYRNRYYGNYYNSYYNGRTLAYNSGRRGSIYNNTNLTGRTINRRSVTNRSVTSRRSTATRSSTRIANRSNSDDVNTTRPRRTVRSTTTRPRTTTTRTRPRTTTTRPRTTTSRPRTTTTRTRSSNNSSVNRSRSSSSNVRSSNNSSRSSSRSSSGRSGSSRRGNN